MAQCYDLSSETGLVGTLPTDVWYQCPSGNTCCIGGSECLDYNLCHVPGSSSTTSGSFSSYYVARCSDPTFTSPDCARVCEAPGPPDAVYNYTTQQWYCCGKDANGDVSCNNPTSEIFQAPAPSNLTELQADVAVVSGATLTPGEKTSTTSTSSSSATSSSTDTANSSLTSQGGTTSTGSSPTDSTSQSQQTGTSSDSSQASSSSSSSSSLSTGAKAGIGVGVALAVIALILLALFFLRRRKRHNTNSSNYHEKGNDHDNANETGQYSSEKNKALVRHGPPVEMSGEADMERSELGSSTRDHDYGVSGSSESNEGQGREGRFHEIGPSR